MADEDWKQKYQDLVLQQRRTRWVRVAAISGVIVLAGAVGYVAGFLRVSR